MDYATYHRSETQSTQTHPSHSLHTSLPQYSHFVYGKEFFFVFFVIFLRTDINELTVLFGVAQKITCSLLQGQLILLTQSVICSEHYLPQFRFAFQKAFIITYQLVM